MASVTDPLGHTTELRCDAAGLPLDVTDPLGAVTRYDLDAFGRPHAITDPTGATTRLDWTVEGSWPAHGGGRFVGVVDVRRRGQLRLAHGRDGRVTRPTNTRTST